MRFSLLWSVSMRSCASSCATLYQLLATWLHSVVPVSAFHFSPAHFSLRSHIEFLDPIRRIFDNNNNHQSDLEDHGFGWPRRARVSSPPRHCHHVHRRACADEAPIPVKQAVLIGLRCFRLVFVLKVLLSLLQIQAFPAKRLHYHCICR